MIYEKMKKISLVILLVAISFLFMGCDEDYNYYINKDASLHKVKKIIVFPFRNLSKDKNADDLLRNAINLELMKSGLFDLINLNEAEKALKEARIRTAGGVEDLAVSQAKKMGESLGVQGIVMGVIEDFGSGGKTGAPQFAGYIYLVDTNDGSILWNCSYTGSGDSKNYIFDINKIETPTLHARKVITKIFDPLIKAAKRSEGEAKRKIDIAEKEAQLAEENATKLENESKTAETVAKEKEEQASRTEKEAQESLDKALKMNPERIRQKVSELEVQLADKGNSLTTTQEEAQKFENVLNGLTQSVKEKEDAEKAARAEAEEIAGQVNIYTAKQRVAAIRNNTEEAEKFKALAEEAKTKSEEATAKSENLKKEVTEAKAKVDEMTPKINDARKKVNDTKADIDKITAKLAEIKQIQESQGLETLSDDLIANAKAEEEKAKKLQQDAVGLHAAATQSRKNAEEIKEKAKQARQKAVEARKRSTDLKARLG